VTAALSLHTLKECVRSPFLIVVGISVILLALASRFLLAFTFGSAEVETIHLGMSAVFLAGFAQAAFQGTGLIRRDMDRGTLGLLLTTPVGPASYVIGRFSGWAISALSLCAAVAGTLAILFALIPQEASLRWALFAAGCARAVLPVLVLGAAALALSAALSRVAAPIALIGLFLAGSLAAHRGVGLLLPDFSLFGLEAESRPSWGPLLAYTGAYVSIFLLVAYIVLAFRTSLRSQS
jgi:ABC-type transport system involved in multi-copper enzyme maturation permease subunit